jgi:hypothetical protein
MDNTQNCDNFILYIPYNLISNEHPFFNFRGLKNQKWVNGWVQDFGKMIEPLYLP